MSTSGSNSCKSAHSDSDGSFITPIRKHPSTTKKVKNWRMSLFDSTSENIDAGGVLNSSVVGNSGLSLVPIVKSPQLPEQLAVKTAVPETRNMNPIVGLDSSLDWSVDVA